MGTIQQWFSHCIAKVKFSVYKKIFGIHLQGSQAEKLAALHLQKHGLKLLGKNYLTKAGEIDLIMKQGSCIVFIEVKYRTSEDWASAIEAVTKEKQKRIIKTAKLYLQKHQPSSLIECRFDVVAIKQQANELKFDWFIHAFY